jgi:hypothetical protein
MTGSVPFEEALAARLSLIKPSFSQIEGCLEKRPPRFAYLIVDSITLQCFASNFGTYSIVYFCYLSFGHGGYVQ